MGFWKNIKILLDNMSDKTFEKHNETTIHEIIFLLIENDIEITEYHIETYYELLNLLNNEKAAAECVQKNITATDIKTLSEAKKLHPMFYYLLYITNETKGGTQ
jgi:hypothetical protein